LTCKGDVRAPRRWDRLRRRIRTINEEDAMRMLLATLAAGGAVAAATALPATGQEAPSSKTLTLTSVQAKGGERAIDAPPRGDSVGDRFVFASSLRRDGRLAGRMEGDCLAVDLKFEGMQCTLTAVLADGSITLQGASLSKHIPGATAPSEDVYAITGGTGAYVGAAGTMRRSGNGKTDTDVFELR
jgi:Allene oxide cyclase barrel like domain